MAFQPISGSGSGSGSNSGFQFFNSPFGDTTFTKVFVGGLAWETQSETMRRYFEQFGDILEAVVISDKNTRRSKGYGFVTFRDPESAVKACADPSPVIDGRRANCNLASLGRPRPSPPYGRLRPANPYFGGVQGPRGAFVQSSTYHQPVSYGYQQGFAYPPYGYTTYGPEFAYPQVDRFKMPTAYETYLKVITQATSAQFCCCVHSIFCRMSTILIWGSNTFRYMVYLEQLTQLFTHLGNLALSLCLVGMDIQQFKAMECPVITSSNLADPVSME
eukprot:TRINITY_DN2767_c0_g4_i4.p1 TRINITY_DN2767_c0_g4~~TRINITY_DN2767_c0_g4_i4.p1  ORF type:complete len:275 (+),score=22.97 TRINITY_DN2767_c0_g4_i4:294-1118(+)